MILQDIKADGSIRIDIWVIDSSGEVDLSWLEWVVGWEMDVQEINTTGIGGIIWAHDGSLPVILVLLVDWSGGAVGRWVLAEVDEFLLDSFDG